MLAANWSKPASLVEACQMVIALSGLSRISRNSRKLLRVVEFFLARQATVLTTNYLLTCKEVWVRRRELVRPDSLRPMGGLQNTSGLAGSHRKIVEAHARQVSQPAEQPPHSRRIAHAGEDL